MKNLALFSCFICLMFVSLQMSAQSDPMFSHYMFNTLRMNPGYAGSADMLSINIASRHQWIGFDGAPCTQTLTVHTPLNKSLAAGLTILNDAVGPQKRMALEANFAYHLRVSEKSRLSLGLMAGVSNMKLNLIGLEGISIMDAAFQEDINSYKPVFGAGLYFYHPNAFIGFSVPDLLETEYTTQGSTWKHDRHYYLTGGYAFVFSDNFTFRPTAMLRYAMNSPISAEITASTIIKQRFWLGLLYRYDDAIGAMLGIQINNQLRIGYSYDYSISELSGFQSGSHEIMLSYDFSFGKSDMVSPRYF